MAEETRNAETEEKRLGTTAEVESLGPCKVRVRARVPADTIRKELDEVYRRLSQTVFVPGFRPGRVPRRLLEVRFGKDLEREMKDSLLEASFGEVVEDKSLSVVGDPRFDNVQFEKDQDFTYEVEMEVRPEFPLPEYKGIEVTWDPEPVGEAEVEEELRELQRSQARLVPIDPRDATSGDVYRGKYVLHRGDLRLTNPREARFVPSEGRIDVFSIPDLAEKVAGWNAEFGAPLSAEVDVPGDFPDEVLRGQRLELRFVLDEVCRLEPPALDDAFAQSLGHENLDALRKEVRDSLEYRARRKEMLRVEASILSKLVDSVAMDLPEGVLAEERERWRERRGYELILEYGLTPEKAAKELEKEGEAADEDIRKRLKARFILERIAEAEGIEVSDDELDQRIELLARYNGVPVPTLKAKLREEDKLEDLRGLVRREKVCAFLRKHAKVAQAPGTAEAQESTDAE